MDRLRGSAETTVDEKGRFKVPAVFREPIEETYGPEFFLTSITGVDVLIYPDAGLERPRGEARGAARDPSGEGEVSGTLQHVRPDRPDGRAGTPPRPVAPEGSVRLSRATLSSSARRIISGSSTARSHLKSLKTATIYG